MDIVTRIAPSPTGQMHIGTVRTALFNYLFAKKHNGTYFVRIEDTDKERNRPEWTEAIWSDFDWVELPPDKKYVTSEHLARHVELLKKIVAEGKAYVSKEPAKDDPTKEVEVVRLKNPGTSITFEDLIRGKVTFDTTELGDFVIARAIDDPLYHFAVVVDDGDAGVTHVIRAEEHLSNTPRQILILEALGFLRPTYAHIPLILAPDRSKLSKRKHAASVDVYRSKGYLPEAIINYLALLGWNPGTEKEIFTMDELIREFSLEKVQHSGAIFDEAKLKWFNREYMLKLSEDSFAEYAKKFLSDEAQKGFDQKNIWPAMIAVMRERASTFGEIGDADRAGEYRFFYEAPTPPPGLFGWKGEPGEASKPRLERVLGLLEALQGEWNAATVKEALWAFAESEGRGQVLWPTRIALSGREKSPDPFTIAGIIGRDETLLRIRGAITALS